MKYVKNKDLRKFKNSPNCLVYDYNLTGKLGMAKAVITGRYPKAGMAVNTKCAESVYIINGRGKIIINKKTIKLKEGDVVLIEPNEKFVWDGKMTLLIITTPAWRKEQYNLID